MVTKSDAAMIVRGIAAHVRKVFAPRAELDALTRRVEALERQQKAAPGLNYRGTWSDGVEYKRGDVVTDGGSLWIALKSTAERPGNSQSTGWQLAVKRGRDGRDGRDARNGVHA